MTKIVERNLSFEFESNWRAAKLDDWSYYRNQFHALGERLRVPCGRCGRELICRDCESRKSLGIKAVDLLIESPDQVLWLLEIKDYRTSNRTKAIDLGDEVAIKARDSLAIVLGAALNANDTNEKESARSAVRCLKVRVALHLEQPARASKLFPQPIKPADVVQRLKQLLKALDAHPRVFSLAQPDQYPWAVKRSTRRKA